MTNFIFIILLVCLSSSFVIAQTPLDTLIFGNADSETSHSVKAENSEIVKGALDESARQLLPIDKSDWQGGKIAFNLKVDPVTRNYVTIRLWGSDVTANKLILYCNGKQIGYRHLGDYEILDIGADEPFYNNRFYYVTSVLPENLTKGQTELNLEIRSTGALWTYGTTFDKYQKLMVDPTRNLYRIYTHTSPQVVPPKDEKQGAAPQNVPVRPGSDEKILNEVKDRINKTVDSIMNSSKPLNQMQLVYLATTYQVSWTNAFQKKKVIERIVGGLDGIFAQYRQDPNLVKWDAATPNPDWFGLGPSGQVISLLGSELKPYLDLKINVNDQPIARRDAWTEMLIASREWHRRNRRLYTNQTMIKDMYIYQANRGIAVLSPEKAFPEAKAKRYLYEAVGIEPWRDSDTDEQTTPELGRRNWGVGKNYWQLTSKGLTRELGYVGYYGEVIDWVGQIYDATRPSADTPGDEKIKAQLEKIIKARSYFRYPAMDKDGFRAMRIEPVVGWRDVHFPGDVVYSERATWDASTIYAAAITQDRESIGHVQQMFDDNQFFASVRQQMTTNNLRVTQGLLKIPDQYELLKKQPKSPHRLPMSPGEPDFVFSDEVDGVLAVKNGDEVLYASLYWRARHGVNFLAKVHLMKPNYALNATVKEEIDYDPSGLFYTRPNWTNFGFANGGLKYPVEFPSAHTGEKLPIAKIPADVVFKPGDESIYAGRGEFYRLSFGDYYLAMNMSESKEFTLNVPPGFENSIDLVTKKKALKSIELAPQTTVVLFRKENNK